MGVSRVAGASAGGLSSPRFDGLEPAAALLHEGAPSARARPILLAVHDEIVVECEEGDAKVVEAWLDKAMIDGMDWMLNGPDSGRFGVPVEVEAEGAGVGLIRAHGSRCACRGPPGRRGLGGSGAEDPMDHPVKRRGSRRRRGHEASRHAGLQITRFREE